MKRTLADRFWAKVDKRAPADCWPWIGASLPDGRGQLWNGSRVVPAPRISMILAGNDPGDLDALHKNECHNPNCVNPAHLYAGTASDNARDSIEIGTFRSNPAECGEENPMAKLTEWDVIDIRSLSAFGATKSVLSREFSVSRTAIRKVLAGHTWGHV